MLRLTAGLALSLAVLAGTACEEPLPADPPISTPSTSTTTAPSPLPPTSGERWVFGASISWMAAGYSQGDGRIWDLNPARGLEDILPKVEYVLSTRPTTVWFADIGTNSAGTWDGRDGWSVDDEWYWWQTLIQVQPGTCAILVLPSLTADAEIANPGVLVEIEEARQWMIRVADMRNLGLADWATWGAGQIGPDGIHINGGPEPAGAWIAMLNDAESRCQR